MEINQSSAVQSRPFPYEWVGFAALGSAVITFAILSKQFQMGCVGSTIGAIGAGAATGGSIAWVCSTTTETDATDEASTELTAEQLACYHHIDRYLMKRGASLPPPQELPAADWQLCQTFRSWCESNRDELREEARRALETLLLKYTIETRELTLLGTQLRDLEKGLTQRQLKVMIPTTILNFTEILEAEIERQLEGITSRPKSLSPGALRRCDLLHIRTQEGRLHAQRVRSTQTRDQANGCRLDGGKGSIQAGSAPGSWGEDALSRQSSHRTQ